MARNTVHNKRDRLRSLHRILTQAIGYDARWQVSDVKADGTVFVRFMGGSQMPAQSQADEACRACHSHNLGFQRISFNRVRTALPAV